MSKKKTDIWMPLYVADYLADTQRLTTEQHGAYFLLLLDYWRNGAPPDNDQVLSQITRLSVDAWVNARSMLEAFFEQRDGCWFHSRVELELEKARDNKQFAEDRARAGAEAMWKKRREAESNASSNALSMPEAKQEAMLQACTSPSPSPSPSKTPAKSPTKPAADAAGADGQEKRRAIWKAYSDAYFARYGTAPVRNAKVNGQIGTLLQRLGSEAEHVAAFFVSINDQFLIKRFHEFGLLVAQAEGYRTQWATGKTMTTTRARQLDQTATNLSAVDETIAMLRAREAAQGGQA